MLLLRLAALFGLAVSAAMYVDYMRPISALCETGSGCDQVRASPFSHLLGVPVPVLGIAGFSVLVAVSLIRHPKARLATLIAALVGAAAAIVFLAIQAVSIRAFCKLCVIVDTSAIVAGAAALTGWRAGALIRSEPVWPWVGAMALWAFLPFAWSRALPPPAVPPQISDLWKPGKINVVEFTDFECPYCRQLHPSLIEAMRSYEGLVHVTRLNVPLVSHRNARGAARAYCCADQNGKGDAMAEALFSANDITPGGCETLAVSLGLELSAYRACVASAPIEQRIESDTRRFREAKLRGLPSLFIGGRLLVGLKPVDELREAFAEAHGGPSIYARLFWLFAGLGLVACLLAIALPGYAFWRTGVEPRDPMVG
jgi:uncharacterized membrane protein/predicted DsbA family dithiol-disulfide isomerase